LVNGTTGPDFIHRAGDGLVPSVGYNDLTGATIGDDLLSGGAGDDIIHGDQGADVLIGGFGDDSLNGGDGLDTADYGQAPSAIMADLSAGTVHMTGGIARIGGEFLVNTKTDNFQFEPTITGLTGGGFVVTWTDKLNASGDPDVSCVKAQIFDAAGTVVGGEFLVNTQTLGDGSGPDITSLDGGGFVVTWTRGDIKAQMFDAQGVRIGSEFLVNSQTTEAQESPRVTSLRGGGFVATWYDYSGTLGDSSNASIKAQVFDAAGSKVGGEFLVNTQTDSLQRSPDISGLANGGFVVTWYDYSGTLGDVIAPSIKAQVYDAAGGRIGGEFLVNTQTRNSQLFPTVTGLVDGGFVVTWQDNSGSQNDYGSSIRAQIYDAAGVRIGEEFLVNTENLRWQYEPTITSLSHGGFVVTWQDFRCCGL